ncbi:MAG: aminotransferase class III-fold pyridoxal phosphate-dependent enzyme [Planctomycetaceae bacterium]|nr:aminotransferase class III-fold pyridoxal phosphate-dependent enzyme [Planctomycetaceae bacterium]
MTTATLKPPAIPAAFPLLRYSDAFRFQYTDADRELFNKFLKDFVPPNSFDSHAHLYDLRHLIPKATDADFAGKPEIDYDVMIGCMQQWMGDRVVRDGLYFPFPVKHLDSYASNEFIAAALKDRPGSRALMILRPADDPATVEDQLLRHRFAGFKVYHVFASRPDTFYAEQGEFLPDWAWELADKHGLAITMHMVLPRALSDARNATYIREHCIRYPGAKLILAHAARGFNARHTVDAIDTLRGLENVYFDTSAVCEPSAFEAIFRAFGTTRLMYGSDFPVSELRGRAFSIGDGFYWLYDHNATWEGWLHAKPELVGIESLLALQQACRTMGLIDRDIERLFGDNARQMLGLTKPSGDPGQELYREAKTIIPGGTQLLSKRPEMFAPGKWPAYYEQAVGCEVIDTDGRRFIDMSHCGILSCILGFADPDVNAAVIRRVNLGGMATQQTADEVELAKLLTEIHPWAEQARFTRGGGDSMAVAVRIARAATGKDKVAVCGYHGWNDWYLAANLAPPDGDPNAKQLDGHLLPGLQPTGVPRGLAGTVATWRYNRLDELDAATQKCGSDLAAIVMEPTRGVDPEPGFLEGVRERATRLGVPLIFDEISSGWRLCVGGAHRLYGVNPDMAVFAKAMGNGFAMGAVIGTRAFMQAAQESFISSTYWTEGVGPSAAVAAIKKMMRVDVPGHLKKLGTRVMEGWKELATKRGLNITTSGRPASCGLAFNHPQAAALMTLFTTRMLDHGFLAGSSCSMTYAHGMHHVEHYLRAVDTVFAELAETIKADDVNKRLAGPVKHSTFARLVD